MQNNLENITNLHIPNTTGNRGPSVPAALAHVSCSTRKATLVNADIPTMPVSEQTETKSAV